MSVVGRHLLAELEGCSDAIDDVAAVERAMHEAVAASGATLLHLRVHPFEPQGVTALALLSESHLALHTWPERRYAAADLFTCGDHVVGERAIAVLESAFGAANVTVRAVERGPVGSLPERLRPHRVADAAIETLDPRPSTLDPKLTEAAP